MAKHCHNKSDIPKEMHFAIMTISYITIPGDERSRTNPGHGYPEHTETTIRYIAFTDEHEWIREIERRHLTGSNDFVAMRVIPATVTSKTIVEVK